MIRALIVTASLAALPLAGCYDSSALVDEVRSERLMGGLMARGYRPSVRSLD